MSFFARVRPAAGEPPDLRGGRGAKDPRDQGRRTGRLRATDENLAGLRDVLARSEERLKAGEGLDLLDQEFHLEIVRATQNTIFLNICTSFYAPQPQPAARSISAARTATSARISEHLQIFDALLRRDAALSSALMVSHLRGAMSYWTEILDPAAPGCHRPVIFSTHPLHPEVTAALQALGRLPRRHGPDAQRRSPAEPAGPRSSSSARQFPSGCASPRKRSSRADPAWRGAGHDQRRRGDIRPGCWSPMCQGPMR